MARLLQKDKHSHAHGRCDRGHAIEFPNQDPFFTTCFPSTMANRSTWGLYESGAVEK